MPYTEKCGVFLLLITKTTKIPQGTQSFVFLVQAALCTLWLNIINDVQENKAVQVN